MQRYRRKPMLVEAFQFVGQEVSGFERICVGRDQLGNNRYNLIVPTSAETATYAAEGCWVLTGPAGRYFVATDEYFAGEFEPLEGGD